MCTIVLLSTANSLILALEIGYSKNYSYEKEAWPILNDTP